MDDIHFEFIHAAAVIRRRASARDRLLMIRNTQFSVGSDETNEINTVIVKFIGIWRQIYLTNGRHLDFFVVSNFSLSILKQNS